MKKTPQQQGAEFEAEMSKAFNAHVRAQSLLMSHKLVNAVGTPFDHLVAGKILTYAFEEKALLESAKNKAYSFRLSALTDNEWIGMTAWIQSPYRRAWVVWKSMLLSGEVYIYAVPFGVLLQARRDGVKHLRVDCGHVLVIGEGHNIDVSKLFREDLQ